jgi:hypothetical protein
MDKTDIDRCNADYIVSKKADNKLSFENFVHFVEECLLGKGFAILCLFFGAENP